MSTENEGQAFECNQCGEESEEICSGCGNCEDCCDCEQGYNPMSIDEFNAKDEASDAQEVEIDDEIAEEESDGDE